MKVTSFPAAALHAAPTTDSSSRSLAVCRQHWLRLIMRTEEEESDGVGAG